MMRYCPLFSGSSGNCAYVATEKTHLLLDGGLPAVTILAALETAQIAPDLIQGILITHEHSDHIKGVGPLSRKLDLPVYANEATWLAMQAQLGDIAPKNIRVIETGRDFLIGDLNITPFAIPHDTAEPVAYTFGNRGAKISHMTDLGCVTNAVLDAVERSDLLLLESNHDLRMLKTGRYPSSLKQRILGKKGHLSNDAAGETMLKLFERKCRRFILGHLSQDNNTEDIAYRTVMQSMLKGGAAAGDYEVYIAKRGGPLAVFQID